MSNLEDELKIGNMYKKVTEDGELLDTDDMVFLENRLDMYAYELIEHLGEGTRSSHARAEHVKSDIQMIIAMMEGCIEILDKEENDPNE